MYRRRDSESPATTQCQAGESAPDRGRSRFFLPVDYPSKQCSNPRLETASDTHFAEVHIANEETGPFGPRPTQPARVLPHACWRKARPKTLRRPALRDAM